MTRSPSFEPIAVLVVEDDGMIRMNAAEFLEDEGFLVVEAANAEEAIRALEGGQPIAAVFTDINMPGAMDGLDLAHFVRDRWPSIKLLLTSGRREFPTTELPPQSRFVLKPYHPEQIAGTLQEMVRGFANVRSAPGHAGGDARVAHPKISQGT
jgi:two-component system, response regulator PdtaR